jgi:uncharacterized protein with PIN domain
MVAEYRARRQREQGVHMVERHYPGILTPGDRCPYCPGQVTFGNWGPSPQGAVTAWYRCDNCNSNISTAEAPE